MIHLSKEDVSSYLCKMYELIAIRCIMFYRYPLSPDFSTIQSMPIVQNNAIVRKIIVVKQKHLCPIPINYRVGLLFIPAYPVS